MPSRKTGEIGAVRVTFQDPQATLEQIEAGLPTNKEALERFFAERFVSSFNNHRVMPGVEIHNLQQRDTSDLDFTIDCSRAKYLELAELTPLSEPFGRKAMKTGEFNTLEYSTWIYDKIIKPKFDKYGESSSRTFLLLYVTHAQFTPGRTMLDCLRSVCFWRGSKFAAIFVLFTTGGTPPNSIEFIERISPHSGTSCPRPETFRDCKFWNLTHLAKPIEGGVSFKPV